MVATIDYARSLVGHWARRAGLGERGASTVEYALLMALIVIVCFLAIEFFGTENSRSLEESGTSISSAG